MSFVRPEAMQALRQYREVIAGACCLGVALWWMLGPGGILAWVGGALGLAGAALVAIGVQRARFRSGSGGPGVVQVDEGRVTYFGPLTGGSVDLSELTALHLDPSGQPAHWALYQPGQPPLLIPLTAEGADQLFDTFATLPGLRTGRLLSAMQTHGGQPVTVWEHVPNRLH
ncbi:hypothetical protein [Roseovarius aestuariivivens]|uniref:hypothetical protein n=1 Tax=Roseovarius aestuariivivens TaxID=1888910 RepID=UPI001080DB2B|nr:hypothetical protein [Roseovarius aestuariivivens]